ncbi:hypothetical protein C8A00DRAFT_46914 [Chaetomidium leptoderma]|uniref:Glucose-methanol-choline oxidoreductase N-terminal domain-containing protein n=1 Tax=Chaetomidium leptoderma TaxID=669021 RepID=A0AAN6VDJ6_9PEZI|nr:hypothetical protein C8A00DRAFT_46914 [Chaetomidium leptoderma]
MGLLGAAFVSLAALTSAASVSNSNVKRQVSQLRDEYDFVIVGGGTSGLTVADRLSQAFPAKNVLVVEYGDVHYAPGTFDPPTDWITPAANPPPTWTFNSLPNPEMGNKTAFVQAGQAVGGSSTVNGMFFDRGSRFDYDAWTEVGGTEFAGCGIKWNWRGIFPYFKKSADQPVLHKAFTEIGIQTPQECAGGDKEGICWVPASQHPVTARRSQAGLGHYADVMPRANYDLIVKHQGVRVVYPNGPKAGPPLVEVRSLDDGHLFNVTVKGEVIISAGAFHTPTVLQRSGIGSAAFLASAGIRVTLDLPGVGSNFQDHSGPPVTWNYTQPHDFFPIPSDMVNNATFKADAIAGFDETPARGPYTLAGGDSAIYVSLPHVTTEYQDIVDRIRQMLLTLANLLANPEAPSLETPWATTEAPGTAWSFLLHPLSRGTVRLDPADHLAQPIVDYRAGSNPVDFDVHLAQVRYLRRLLDTPTLQQHGATEIGPGAAVAADDAQLTSYVKAESVLSFMHPCCTAAMMPKKKGGVVGPRLKVHGAVGLRVVDMSIMPLVPATHLSATAYAVGEKAADIIIQEWTALARRRGV